MKLLFFIHSLSAGGAERVTANLANYWAKKGWTVTIVTVTGQESDFYTLDERIQRIPLGLDSNSPNPLLAMINNLRRIRALRAVLRLELPDVAVAMMTTANALLALAARGLGVPTIGAERIYPPSLPLGRIWEFIRRVSYPKLSALVAQTRQGAEWLKKHASAPQIEIITNPLNYPIARSKPEVPLESVETQAESRHILLAVGRLEQQKGFDRLLTAFSLLSTQYPNWILVILGDGSLRNELMRMAECLGISDKVYMPGSVGNVSDWYENADIYVLTSRFEGFPNTLLEAMAHGLPSIAVDCETGPREILRHEVDGLLVPQDDQHTLIMAMKRLMSDETLRLRLAQHASGVRERFAIEQVAERWEILFKKVMR